MGGASHPGVARAGASFELDSLEVESGRLVVRGWWFGVRGVRFVRPALIVDDRQILATLEHKPWAADPDGAWIAAFPWKRRRLDVGGVTLVVAPSVEVPLDREAAAPPPPAPVALRPRPAAEPAPSPPRPAEPSAAPPRPAEPQTSVRELSVPLRDELAAVERRLDDVHDELREARGIAAEREARCRELEQLVARERQAALRAQATDDEGVRSHAMAVLDRDRALAQLEEAVGAREAAVRARKRSEAQRDEALVLRDAAEARRDEALAERDEARRQRDEVLLGYSTLQAQLNDAWAQSQRTHADGVAPHGDEPTQPLGAAEAPPAPPAPAPAPAPRTMPAERARSAGDEPLGVRVIPAAGRVGGHLHRSQREREQRVTKWDMWVIRVLGSLAALSFIALLVMILQAFFVF